jgi:hypothetical protein
MQGRLPSLAVPTVAGQPVEHAIRFTDPPGRQTLFALNLRVTVIAGPAARLKVGFGRCESGDVEL